MPDRSSESAPRDRRTHVLRVLMRVPGGGASVLLAMAVAAAPAAAAQQGLPSVSSGHRPGPDALYATPAEAPQLAERRRRGRPHPILVSGAQAYRDGEWLYQDFLYDDHGASGRARPERPARAGRPPFSPRRRHVHLPDRPGLREQRGRPGRAARQAAGRRDRLPGHAQHAEGRVEDRRSRSLWARRMRRVAWPHGAGVSSPAAAVPHRARDAAELSAATGSTVARPRQRGPRAPAVRRARAARGVGPGDGTVRIDDRASGLWDAAAGSYLRPRRGRGPRRRRAAARRRARRS